MPNFESKHSNSQTTTKLVILYVFSLGIYFYYWYFRNYKQFKSFGESSINPYWKTLILIFYSIGIPVFIGFYEFSQTTIGQENNFSIYYEGAMLFFFIGGPALFLYLQLKHLDKYLNDAKVNGLYPLALGLSYGVLGVLVWFIPNALLESPQWEHKVYFGLLSFVRVLMGLVLCNAQKHLNAFWKSKQEELSDRLSFSSVELLIVLVGGVYYFWQFFLNPAEDIQRLQEWFSLNV